MKKKNKDNKAYCEYCDKMFYNNKGLKIHIGRMHNENAIPNNPTIEINKRKWELCDPDDNMCQDCGTPFTVKEGLRWHIGKCQKRRKTFHESRNLTPANKQGMRKTEIINDHIKSPELNVLQHQSTTDSKLAETVSQKCSECNQTVEAVDIKTLLSSMNKHNTMCTVILANTLSNRSKCEHIMSSQP